MATDNTDPLRLWFRFIRLNQRLHGGVSQRLRGTGLSIPQFDVLSTLTELEGMTQQELAKRLYVTKGNVSGLIDRLVEAGLAERRAIPGDRRSHALHLTETGRALAKEAMTVHAAFVADTLGRLPEKDIASLYEILGRWRDIARERIG